MSTRRTMLKFIGGAALVPALPALATAQSPLRTRVTNIRAAIHAEGLPQFDRVVVDMTGPVPTHITWQYNSQLIDRETGQPVELEGPDEYEIRLRGAQAHDDLGRSTMVRRELITHFPVVQQVLVFSDFEGLVLVGIGLSRATRTRNLVLHDSVGQTTRAVVDFLY